MLDGNGEIDIKAFRKSIIFSEIHVVLKQWAGWLINNIKQNIDYRRYMDDDISEVWYFLKDALGGAADSDVQYQIEYVQQRYAKLVETLRSIRAYMLELEAIDEVVGTYYHERIKAKQLQRPVNSHRLLHRIEDFISCRDLNDDDKAYIHSEQDLRMQDIISILPMPMSKQWFYDYVRRTLTDAFEYMDVPNVDEAIKRLKERFTGKIEPHYGVLFPHIASEIERIQSLAPLKLSTQQLDAASGDTVVLIRDVLNILEIYITMRLGLLAWKGWLELDEKMPESWARAVKYIDQLEQMVPGAVSEEQLDQLYQSITDVLDSQIEDNQDDDQSLKDILADKDSLADKILGDLTEEIDRLIPDEIVYGANVDWDIESEEPADDDYIRAKIDELISFINDTIADMPSMYRRAHMKALMLAMPVGFYDIDEFIDYVERALEFMPSDGVLAFIEQRFDELLEEYEKPEDQDEMVDDKP